MNRKREIAVDLTSLLDVILIILFMFVVNSSSTVANSLNEENATNQKPEPTAVAEVTLTPVPTQSPEEVNSELNEQITIAKSELEKLQSAYDEMQKQVASNEIMFGSCVGLTITCKSGEDNNSTVYLEAQGKEIVEVEISRDSKKKSKNLLKTTIKDKFLNLSDLESYVVLIFQYSDNPTEGEGIYRKDYICITEALEELTGEYSNVCLRYYDTYSNVKTAVEGITSTAQPIDDASEPETPNEIIDDNIDTSSSDNTEGGEASTDTSGTSSDSTEGGN